MTWPKFRARFQPRRMMDVFQYQVASDLAALGMIELMDNFCSAHSLAHRRRRDMRGQLRYCFAISTDADDFAANFGGWPSTLQPEDARRSRFGGHERSSRRRSAVQAHRRERCSRSPWGTNSWRKMLHVSRERRRAAHRSSIHHCEALPAHAKEHTHGTGRMGSD